MNCCECHEVIGKRDAVCIVKHGPSAGKTFCQEHAPELSRSASRLFGMAGELTAQRYVWAKRLAASVQAPEHCDWCQVFALLRDVLVAYDQERQVRQLVQSAVPELHTHLGATREVAVTYERLTCKAYELAESWGDWIRSHPGSVNASATRGCQEQLLALLDSLEPEERP